MSQSYINPYAWEEPDYRSRCCSAWGKFHEHVPLLTARARSIVINRLFKVFHTSIIAHIKGLDEAKTNKY